MLGTFSTIFSTNKIAITEISCQTSGYVLNYPKMRHKTPKHFTIAGVTTGGRAVVGQSDTNIIIINNITIIQKIKIEIYYINIT